MMQPGYVYIIHGIGTNFIKVGKTTNLLRRLREIGQGVPFPVRALFAELVDDMDAMELAIKARYAAYERKGEWFLLSDDALAYWPAYTTYIAEPIENPRRLRLVRPQVTLRDRILRLLGDHETLTVRQLQRMVHARTAAEIKAVVTTLADEGVIVTERSGKMLICKRADVA
jgi:T5orf172 domain